LLDVFLPEGEYDPSSLAGDVTRACAFPDTGYISLHTDPWHPEKELALVARSSRYGSISHEHADQGSFALLCGGTALISPSGYFGRGYGTKHHREWTNHTRAHNTILVNDQEQEDFSYRATGKVLYARDEEDVLKGAVDPSHAYEQVEKWQRSFELRENELVVEDEIELKAPGKISWLLHALSEPLISGNQISLTRKGIHLEIIPEGNDLKNPSVSDQFDTPLNEGEPEAYHVTMPQQYHMKWETEEKKNHHIRVHFKVCR